ncbi:peptidoglycan-binding domain-containing protein [Bythopirellula goksoeyrii]|uniref:Peptidoglycan binding domain protein n=1 Tax=Bythopirellula goksoeyrii TaxID=1400387 RepID=A0A5B9QUL3_9BACT|nr:peptidoglycan-binding domain-containing protein [Bythopirellula goksoeyrii]QEG37603.1 Putative peptidoglycan binding domain protein [Bythopirellula goksoeyrii]
MGQRIAALFLVGFIHSFAGLCEAVDFEFYGRTGNGIELDFSSRLGVPGGASFSGLSLSGFGGHTVLTSSDLNQGNFASDGQLWVFANPARNTPGLGDTNPAARGFQGALTGSVLVNGEQKTFSVVVQPGYTGAGPGSVGQSLESLNKPGNNPLFVAQQQQRLRYLGFVREGGAPIAVDGDFGPNTNAALRTFQAAFVAGINTTQSSVDGIVGPNTAGWLNAANAPTWEELIDPDPQVPGTFSVNNMIGDFDILPSRDPGTNQRTGLTPQIERFGTSWAHTLWKAGSASAKTETGITQLMNAMSTADGYGSASAHSTHRVGMDIDMHVDVSTWNFGNGVTSTAEQNVIDIAVEYIDSGASGGSQSGRVIRIISSNQDILDGINSQRPSTATWFDSSGAHQNHLHLDVGSPTRIAGLADRPGDFNFDDQVDGRDFLVWQRGGSSSPHSGSDLALWQGHYNASLTASVVTVPEPGSGMMLVGLWMLAAIGWWRKRNSLCCAGAPHRG